MSATPKQELRSNLLVASFDYSSTAAWAAAKFSLFIRDSEGLCKHFVSQNFSFLDYREMRFYFRFSRLNLLIGRLEIYGNEVANHISNVSPSFLISQNEMPFSSVNSFMRHEDSKPLATKCMGTNIPTLKRSMNCLPPRV